VAAAGRRGYGPRVERTVDTEEVALEPGRLRAALGAILGATPGIERLFGHEVRSLGRTPAGFRVGGVDRDGGAWTRDVGLVVNALWEGRLAVDRLLGIEPPRPWVYRLKYRLLGRPPPALSVLAPTTVVLGAYGDALVYPGGRLYVSWYPACLRGWSTDLVPPPEWEGAHEGRIDPGLAATIAGESARGFADLLPGLEAVRWDEISAGVIFSWGASDIDDPDSELHRRDEIGVAAHDGYYSINTGKLTCAPLHARALEAAIGGA
jgi:hypothetical protein